LYAQDPTLKVVFFKSETCGPCKAFTSKLQANRIPFKSIIARENMALFSEADQMYNFQGKVPQIFVDGVYRGSGEVADQVISSLRR
jgi:glutaredoxin